MIIAEGQIFKIAASRFVDVSEEEINLMKENAITRGLCKVRTGWRLIADTKMRMIKCGWKNADDKMRMEKCG